MSDKSQIARFLLESGAFRGEETRLKSGRLSPYFFNTGIFDDGEKIIRLGSFYTEKLVREFTADGFDVIFGPAYKGIPLAIAICVSLFSEYRLIKKFSFNRKEEKTYGERGKILGHRIVNGDRVIIVDDVFTTGGTKMEAVKFIKGIAPGSEIKGLVITLDRQEKDENGQDAISIFTRDTGVSVYSLITITEFLNVTHCAKVSSDHGDRGSYLIDTLLREKIVRYLRKYGVMKNEIKYQSREDSYPRL